MSLEAETEGSFFSDGGESDIEFIPCRDTAVVIREDRLIDYTRLSKEEIARNLLKHQQIIESIMQKFSIVPFRFGTTLRDKEEVVLMLSKGNRLIKDILERVRDKIEVNVTVTWQNFPLFLKEIGEEEDIRRIKEQLLSVPSEATLEEKMKVGFLVKKRLDEKKEKYRAQILEAVKAMTLDMKIQDSKEDSVVLNGAFLIPRQEWEKMENALEKLNRDFEEKLHFRCVAPLAPYSFFTLEVKKFTPEEIQRAREKLHLLSETITKNDLKKAYHQAAHLTHPDKNPGAVGMAREFQEVTRAYEILWAYCLSGDQAGRAEPYSFREEDFGDYSLFLSVRAS